MEKSDGMVKRDGPSPVYISHCSVSIEQKRSGVLVMSVHSF